MKIKVAFFLPSLEPGGTEKNVVNLVNAIDKEKHAVSLLLGNMEGDFISQVQPNVPIINLHAPYSVGLFFALLKYLKETPPDIFISAFPRINIICLVAKIAVRAKTKIIITEHSVFSFLPVIAKTPFRRLVARVIMPTLCAWLYPGADAIVCVSRGIADDIIKTVGNPEKIRVIYNPVIDGTTYQLAQQPVGHPWFSDPVVPVIIAVGRLVACKNYPALLKAFKLVLEKQPARLVILGKGPQKDALLRLVGELGLADRVAFLGFQENPYQYMSKASVFVLSSLQEGFGNVIIEAMASGTPVVSTDCPTGPAEIIESMKNGILVPLNDEKSLASAIMVVLNNPVLAETLKSEGKKRAEFFSIKKSTQAYEHIFQTLHHA